MVHLKSIRTALLALGIFLLSACSRVESPITRAVPTPTLTAARQVKPKPQTNNTPNRPTKTPQPSPISTTDLNWVSAIKNREITPTVLSVHSSATPEAIDKGIRPDQAVQNREAESGPDPLLDWRPPPMTVPLSFHPDDHYWLARPLASDSRNYDLEWYQYGNEPMLAGTFPYRVHHGMDFPNKTGTPIFAASDGIVVWAGPLASTRSGVNYYGNTVVILHDWRWQDQNVYTLYAHTLELFVEVGDRVERGQLIAGVGASGEVSGPHLHLEVRVGENSYGSTRNPALWLAPYEGWGTLAGRFVDSRGKPIHGALVTVRPVKVESPITIPTRRQRTYSPTGVNSDEVWQENFVVADLPAGEYTLFLNSGGNLFRRNVQILPGQTNFVIIQADFQFVPTPTPTPTNTPTPTGTITGALSSEPTATPTLDSND
ncbi:MAG: hypothetical protein BMS9Abin02_1111 [Anaerolineae bacterium]|nr:MAG: hypothetical protein BMS9Abin02_1111 [Anaerolineae bacterium]